VAEGALAAAKAADRAELLAPKLALPEPTPWNIQQRKQQ